MSRAKELDKLFSSFGLCRYDFVEMGEGRRYTKREDNIKPLGIVSYEKHRKILNFSEYELVWLEPLLKELAERRKHETMCERS